MMRFIVCALCLSAAGCSGHSVVTQDDLRGIIPVSATQPAAWSCEVTWTEMTHDTPVGHVHQLVGVGTDGSLRTCVYCTNALFFIPSEAKAGVDAAITEFVKSSGGDEVTPAVFDRYGVTGSRCCDYHLHGRAARVVAFVQGDRLYLLAVIYSKHGTSVLTEDFLATDPQEIRVPPHYDNEQLAQLRKFFWGDKPVEHVYHPLGGPIVLEQLRATGHVW